MGRILDNDGAKCVLICNTFTGWFRWLVLPALVVLGGFLFVCLLTVGLWVLAWRLGG